MFFHLYMYGIRAERCVDQSRPERKTSEGKAVVRTEQEKKHTSSPSLRNLGEETYARLRIRSWVGLETCVKTNVSPEMILLTRASSRAMVGNWGGSLAEEGSCV